MIEENVIVWLLVLIVVSQSFSVFSLRCYDGSAFHLGDAFVTDSQLRPSKGLRFTNWNYILVKENCSSCSTILYTQEPKSGDNTPTVLFHLICDKAKQDAPHSKSCALNEKKFKADIKAMDTVDLSNLELSDKVPDWEDRNDLKSRVSSRLIADLNATPLRVLSNSKRTCRTCQQDLCNYFDMNVNVSCSVRFGIQTIHTRSGIAQCPAQHGCLVHTNITWNNERHDRAACLPKGCSRAALAQCERFCGDAAVNKKCSCWCNGDYSVKSYNLPTSSPDGANDAGYDELLAGARDSGASSSIFQHFSIVKLVLNSPEALSAKSSPNVTVYISRLIVFSLITLLHVFFVS